MKILKFSYLFVGKILESLNIAANKNTVGGVSVMVPGA